MKAFWNLRVRLTAVCAVSTGLVLIGMALVSYAFSARQLQEQFAQSFAGSAQGVLGYLREQPVVTHTWLMNTEAENNLLIAVSSDSNQLVYGSGDPRRRQLTETALRTAREAHGLDAMITLYGGRQPDTVFFLQETGDGRFRASITPLRVQDNWLVVTILANRADEYRQLGRLRLAFAGSALFFLFCLMLFAWFFSRWAARPVEQSRKRQVEFVGAASHEFRSPVSVIQISAERIRDEAAHLVGGYADMILRECARLARLTADMLQLAGADSRNMRIRAEPANPEALVRSAQEEYQGMASAGRIALRLRLPPEPLPKILCDRERIEQVLAILLDNALQYTPAGGAVILEAGPARGGVLLSVTDSGPGVPDSEKNAIFERFHRGDRARSDKEHYGLGLSIAKEIMELHGGSVGVSDAPGGGSVFTLFLPFRKNSS